MTLPGGVFVETIDAAATYDASEAVDQHFMVGQTERGSSTVPARDFSLEQWVARWGNAVANSSLYQFARTFFAEGGKALVTLREVGPSPVKATSTAKNTSSEGVVKIEAINYGVYGNSLTRQFVAGVSSGVQLIIREGSTILTQSGDLTTQAAIASFANSTGVVTATILGPTGLPVVDGSAVALTGGTDDHASATNTQTAAALALLDTRMGPGTVSLPGKTTEEAHALLIDHHEVFDRIGLADLPDSGSGGTLTGNIAVQRSDDGADGVAAFAPWVVTPDGFDVPPASFAAAKIAQTYLATGNPNEPAAGTNGRAQWIAGLTQDFSVATREALDAGGVNAIYNVDGQGDIQLYGYDTLADPTADPLGTALSNAMLDMLIRWKARAIGRRLAFKEIDPKGRLASKYHGELDAMLKTMQAQGALWAFSVDTQSVNSAETARELKLNARMKVERSPYSKEVFLDVTNYATGAVI